MLVTDDRSIDWAGLPLVVGLIGIVGIDGLVNRLMTMKRHARSIQNNNSAVAKG